MIIRNDTYNIVYLIYNGFILNVSLFEVQCMLQNVQITDYAHKMLAFVFCIFNIYTYPICANHIINKRTKVKQYILFLDSSSD